MRRFLLALALLLLPLPGGAQDDAAETERDRDFLTAFLEDNLSGLGRTVRIEGFRGALSSRATFDELTIADRTGVWITIRDGAIAWNRSALLSGRVEIREMSAAEIDLPRRPAGSGATAEASGFSLPELPVSVDIGTLRADRVVLGEALFGAAAVVKLNGTMHLEGGESTADLAIDRTDGPRGRLSLTGSYANATRKATLDLLVTEGPDGIAANLLNLPDRPSLELAVHGDGVIDDFATDIALSTDGVRRLSGSVTTRTTVAAAGAAPERSFAADLRGDIAPLFRDDYRDFFGPDVALKAEGRRRPSGQLDLTQLDLDARGLDLSGQLSLAPEGVPLRAALTVRLGLGGGGEILLPLPGARTFVRSGDLKIGFDHARGDGWALDGTLSGYRREGLSVGSVTLSGSGRIGRAGTGSFDKARAGGTVRFTATGLAATDPAIGEALGPELSGRAVFFWQEGEPLRLPDFELAGQGYGATGSVALTHPEAGTILSGRVEANVADLGRFSALAGRPLGGAGTLSVSGSGGLLSGIFDIEATLTGRNLTVDQAEADRLLAGESRIVLSAARDTTGLTIRALDLRAATLSVNASGRLATGTSNLRATLDFSDLSALGPQYRGALAGEARLTETGETRTLSFEASGNGFGVGRPEIDRLLAGPATLSLAASGQDGTFGLETLSLTNPQLSVTARGAGDNPRRIELSARLADMALLTPGFPGPLSGTGTMTETANGWSVDLAAEGPGATNARVTGTLAPDLSSADLSLAGGGQSAIVNPFIAPRNVEGPVSFDLRLSGPLAASSLSGRVALQGGRLVAPTFGIQLEGLRLAAELAGGRAMLQGNASVRGGGEVSLSGPVALAPPFDGDLAIRLAAARLRDPELYDTTVSGNVRVNGPLLGGAMISGAVALGRTEVRVPSTGLGADPVLREIVHVHEPGPVHDTRVRAGLAGVSGAAERRGAPFGLDLTITAPERIFVRGRGLDAELGGALRLTGTTDNIVPSGRFTLIRGRLVILGKRFTIDEGLIELQGALTPYIRFTAQSQSNGTTVTIVIEGEATAPEIRFLSTPELPEEEVMAQLLFGRSLTSLSPLQAAQLASAVAQLAGTGGEGIVGRLRSSFGLDDVDVTTADDGSAALRVGKYLSEKVYTDVTVGSEGKTEINLNLDIRPGVTARGTLASDGSSGIGIYYERDY